MSSDTLHLRRDVSCVGCGATLPAEAGAWSEPATCLSCRDRALAIDLDARSRPVLAAFDGRCHVEAQRQQDPRAVDAAWREQFRRENPILGRLATATKARPSTGPGAQGHRTWTPGAEGEIAVATLLAGCQNVISLHDRRVPGTKNTIGHVAVGPGGIYVVEAKQQSGLVERRGRKSLLQPDERLFVDGRDRTDLLRSLDWQVAAVRSALDGWGCIDVRVRRVLCLFDAEWPRFGRPVIVHGVMVLWPSALPAVVSAGHLLDTEARERAALHLAAALPTRDAPRRRHARDDGDR